MLVEILTVSALCAVVLTSTLSAVVVIRLYGDLVERGLASPLIQHRQKATKTVTRTEKARAAIAAKGGAHE